MSELPIIESTIKALSEPFPPHGIRVKPGSATKRAWQRWTEREDAFIAACVPEVSPARIGFILDRSPKSVLHRVHALGIRYLAHPARFWAKVAIADGCWLWQGARMSAGYGAINIGGNIVLAHRYSYELTVGPIGDGQEVHHTCECRACVNPAHLEALTPLEHRARHPDRARQAPITHCKHGHELTPENSYTGRGWRECRECRRIAGIHSRARRKVA